MKKILILAIVAIMALPVVADDSSKNADGKARNSDRMTQLFNAKVKMMKEKLLLTEEQTEKFIPVYKEYMEAIGKTLGKRPPEVGDVKTVDEASKVIIDGLNVKIKVVEVQKTYIPKFAKVLTPQQLLKLLPAESDIQREVRKEFKRRAIGERKMRKQERREKLLKKRRESDKPATEQGDAQACCYVPCNDAFQLL